jgi:enamine deaminase RidA (YjgF/YER057c/UK114 family)
MSIYEQKLKDMGLALPQCPKPVAAYVPAVEVDGLVFVSGQTPIEDGKIVYQGKLGDSVTVEQGYEAAKICALRLLSQLKAVVGDLDRVERIVKVNGYVNSVGAFGDQPFVINGASELFEQVFGEKGKHARAAIGVSTLPGDAAVEVEMVVKVK